MKLIGLTGNIGSGKTEASHYLETKGYYVLSFDKLGHEVLFPQESAFEQIVEVFGKNILTLEGTINRKKLTYVAFTDKDKYQLLNTITHTAITDRAKEQLAKVYACNADSIVILDIPLLFESTRFTMLEFVILISSKEKIRKERICKYRNYTQAEAQMRIDKQQQEAEKIKKAQFVVDNNKDLPYMYRQLDEVIPLFDTVTECNKDTFFKEVLCFLN